MVAESLPRVSGCARALVLLACLLPVSCASPVSLEGGRYRSRAPAYSIAAPPGAARGVWRRESVAGADLVFRRADGASMSLLASCSRPVADPQLLARQLLIGAGEREVLQAGPIEVAGHAGWTQSVLLHGGSRTTLLRSVSVLVDGCTYDWLLVLDGVPDPAEAEFDAWWPTFAPEPAAGGSEEGT